MLIILTIVTLIIADIIILVSWKVDGYILKIVFSRNHISKNTLIIFISVFNATFIILAIILTIIRHLS